ncbi:MAG: PadR family transcriptional regulator, partial [Anaerolineales bacterium]
PDGPGLVWRLKQAQLYALLGKLEENGLLLSTLQAQETRPTRRVYRLTDKGERTYEDWLSSPVSNPRQIRQEFMVKLYFAKREPQPPLRALIDSQLSVCERWLESHERQFKNATEGSFRWTVTAYRLGQIQATQAWLVQLKEELLIGLNNSG